MTLLRIDGSEYPQNKQDVRLRELAPRDELSDIIREATQSVENQLAIEDAGWINLSGQTGEVITSAERITNLKLSRLYAVKDPLGKQSIRLWTDYTFGTGMVWSVPDAEKEGKATNDVLQAFWNAPENKPVLSPRGQRKSSDKLLIDGEIYFAIFLGPNGKTTIRYIDPLEITEIITDQDDKEKVLYYKRAWSTPQGKLETTIYRSSTNIKGEPGIDSAGASVQKNDEALVYHLTYNTTTQRGNPLLLPALDWIKQYRRFLSSRIAVMLALARFAWRTKVDGGAAAVEAIKAVTEGKTPNAGSTIVENLGSDTTPIKTESGASAAYRDGKMIQHQVFATVGIPEQYFGDISTGNLATAKTVELPMLKMFESYQAIWDGAYQDIDEIVLAHNNIPPSKWYVDRDFPSIDAYDVASFAKAIMDTVATFPEFANSPEVMQVALMNLGIDDPAEVIAAMEEELEKNPPAPATEANILKAVKLLREAIRNKEL